MIDTSDRYSLNLNRSHGLSRTPRHMSRRGSGHLEIFVSEGKPSKSRIVLAGLGARDSVDVRFDGTWTETLTKERSVRAGRKGLLVLNPQS